MGTVHTHQIRVETPEERVTVQIGGEGTVPGGFAKLFNRVIDSEAWARLSDAGRAAYLPLVRFADHRNAYRVQIGQAGLMKYAGLSRSSIKRAIKDLLASGLVVLVEQGGVSADGRNESNLYQLMVPTDPRPKRIGGRQETSRQEISPQAPTDGETYPAQAKLARAAAFEAAPESRLANAGSTSATAGPPTPVGRTGGPAAHPQGVHGRTPSRFAIEPPLKPDQDPVRDPARTAGPDRWTARGGFGADPQLRSFSEIEDNSRAAKPSVTSTRATTITARPAAVLLEENGVDAAVADQLAAAYPLARVIDVIETMQFRRSRGKCENPGGFIREALLKQWQTPRAVYEAREKAQARARVEAAEQKSRQARTRDVDDVSAEERQVDRLIDALDDDELALMADEVLRKYEGNVTVLAVLKRKPPRACRLMRMEIAGMLK